MTDEQFPSDRIRRNAPALMRRRVVIVGFALVGIVVVAAVTGIVLFASGSTLVRWVILGAAGLFVIVVSTVVERRRERIITWVQVLWEELGGKPTCAEPTLLAPSQAPFVPTVEAAPSVSTNVLAGAPPGVTSESLPSVQPPVEASADPVRAFEQGQLLLSAGNRAEAIACFRLAFRSGSPDIRQRALAELEKLGEVETF